jgi:hypothetical protein
MDAREKYGYWLDIAQYDLETAGAMLDSGWWLYDLNRTKEVFAWLLTQKP